MCFVMLSHDESVIPKYANNIEVDKIFIFWHVTYKLVQNFVKTFG